MGYTSYHMIQQQKYGRDNITKIQELAARHMGVE